MHVLHAIHDFLPRHRAGSEIYAFELARAQMARHHVTVLCADYDPGREHGHVVWRVHDGLAVVELINNWRCASFEETYRPPLIADRMRHVLRTIRPDVVHVHNLLNLSFDLPAIARELGIRVVATLHDYTLVCASGGQRVHRRDHHVCADIESARCARCFVESPFYSQAAFSRVAPAGAGRAIVARVAAAARRHFPVAASHAAAAAGRLSAMNVSAADIDGRLAAARDVFSNVDVFVAPSAALGREFERLGLPSERLRISDYGLPPISRTRRARASGPLRLGFVGTVVWHKGLHVLIDAIRALPKGSCRALIFGDLQTFPDYVSSLRASAAGLPVEFVGAFPNGDAVEAYRQIDVLAVPSLWPENSPLVIHEAFMAGVPVIGARTGGIPELVTDGVNGWLCESGSPADLAKAIQRFIDRPALVADMAAAAPAIKTSAEDAAEWDAIYRQLLDAGARTA